MKWLLTAFMLTGMAALTGPVALAQAPAAAKERAGGQMDFGVGGFWTFTKVSSGLGVQQTPSNSYGGIAEFRYIASPLIGAEIAISYNNANQAYAPKAGACALVCQTPATSISTKAIEPSIDYIASYKVGNLRPFVVGGLGFFVAVPGATLYGNNTSIRGAYVVGGGVDYDFSHHLGVRLQFRDNFYKAPNVSAIFPATGVFTSSAEPMGGVYYRF